MEIWDLNLRHLKAVARIIEHGTIHAAAAAVNLSQPATTQGVRRLETQLGLPLFERRFDGMVPTEAALLFAPRIEAADARLDNPHVTMSRLRALLALADHGTYAGASRAAGLSVPSIHRAVADLSLAMRKKLVERSGKLIVLTEAGEQTVRAFRLAKLELETGLSEIAALQGVETRRIAIGAMPLSRVRVLPGAVTRFMRSHPKVQLIVAEGSRNELLEPLRHGTLDLMIGALRDPILEEDLVQHPLFEDLPAVYGRSGHPLAGGRMQPSAQMLAQVPWIVPRKGTPLRESFERFFADAGVDAPPVPVESGSVTMARQILLDSDCLALFSPNQVTVETEAGWLDQIATLPPGLGRTIGVTYRDSWRPTEVQNAFLECLAEASKGPVVTGHRVAAE